MNRQLVIREREAIGEGLPPYFIAEIGTNHNRSIETAREMLHAIAEAGCQCAKFQIYEPEEIVSAGVRASDYGLDSVYGDISAREMFEKYLKTPKDWFPELRDLCHDLNMDFGATIHGENGIEWAKETGLDLVKVASMDHTNIPFIKSLINELNVPIVASLGMTRLDDCERLISTLKEHKYGHGVFHCSAVYPPTTEELRLSNISYLLQNFSTHVGFSDHTTGIEDAVAARRLGAQMFEKHITQDKTQIGPDHPFAMEFDVFGDYMKRVKKVAVKYEDQNGIEYIEPFPRELKNRMAYLKSIITRRQLNAGHILEEDDVYLARPATGIPPHELANIIGCKLSEDVDRETPLQWSNIQLTR